MVDLPIRPVYSKVESPPSGGVVAIFVLGIIVIGGEESGPDLFADFAGEGEESEGAGHSCDCGRARAIALLVVDD
jgi:hypothetical protein